MYGTEIADLNQCSRYELYRFDVRLYQTEILLLQAGSVGKKQLYKIYKIHRHLL